MTKMVHFLKGLWKSEKGATAIEYGLLAALIAVAIIATVTALGDGLNATFSAVNNELATADTGTPPATP